MSIKETNSIYVFIDASNLWEAFKVKGKFLDYQKISVYLKEKFQGTQIQIFFYSAYPAQGTRGYSLEGRHKFFYLLETRFGYIVRKKELKRIPVSKNGNEEIKEKGNMDVEITIDCLDRLKEYNTAVLFTGDSDFLALVTHLKKFNKKVYIFSSQNNISQELRTGGDGYFDILDIEDDIWGKDLERRKTAK